MTHRYVCEFCGQRVAQNDMPHPGNSCLKNPNGKFHSWVMDSEDGRTHKWMCAYCGQSVNQRDMPHPGNSCNKNPDGKFHKWIKTN